MAPRFNGVPNFDFSILCPACGCKIQPNELMRVRSGTIKCPRCGQVFEERPGKKLLSTS
jgi:transposase